MFFETGIKDPLSFKSSSGSVDRLLGTLYLSSGENPFLRGPRRLPSCLLIFFTSWSTSLCEKWFQLRSDTETFTTLTTTNTSITTLSLLSKSFILLPITQTKTPVSLTLTFPPTTMWWSTETKIVSGYFVIRILINLDRKTNGELQNCISVNETSIYPLADQHFIQKVYSVYF